MGQVAQRPRPPASHLLDQATVQQFAQQPVHRLLCVELDATFPQKIVGKALDGGKTVGIRWVGQDRLVIAECFRYLVGIRWRFVGLRPAPPCSVTF